MNCGIIGTVSYAMRALIELAAAEGTLVSAEQLAQEQSLPGKAVEAVLAEPRRAGLVLTRKGPGGGSSQASAFAGCGPCFADRCHRRRRVRCERRD